MNIIIQARCSSTRLPNKVLTKVNNISIIEHVVNRILKIKENKNIILATSDQKEDDQIEKIAKLLKIKFFRGSLKNVYKRYYDLINKHELANFIRISGDSPLIDYNLIRVCYKTFIENKYDLVTNKYPRSFPIGQTVEVINSKKFLESKKFVNNSYLEEHVTMQMYNNNFNYYNFLYDKDYSKFNLAIDCKDDLKKFNKFINYNKKNDLKLKEIIKFYEGN
tara:strand:+ start:1024 stop:1686 length:663 start_codon:yes stop_codon:yes gene_type:complete